MSCACLHFVFFLLKSLSSPLSSPRKTQTSGPTKLDLSMMVAVIVPTCALSGWQWWQEPETLLQVKGRLTRL